MTTRTTAAATAMERELDWLLDETLGEARAGALDARRAAAVARQRARSQWRAAAIALLAIGVALGVAWLQGREDAEGARDGAATVQQPAAAPWHECGGPAELDAVPADVTALRCASFDDDACARLARFTKLERLDLSAMRVDERGIAYPPRLTDAGVRALAPLAGLRWVSLAQCADMKGDGLQALEALPRLEHLDLTYSGVGTRAVQRLERMPALRTLVLSHCLNFHGSALAAVARIPGLRRLELQGCATLAAADAMHLARLREVRHLDLRDCQGRFRGQTLAGFDELMANDGPEPAAPGEPAAPPPPREPDPVQDGIGITDAVVVALAALPLETFLLGGSESLTDAIGPALAKMTTLRALDLSNLPKTTSALLASVPAGIVELGREDNWHLPGDALRGLPALPDLRVLGVRGIVLREAELTALLAGRSLHELRLGGLVSRGKDVAVFMANRVSVDAAAGAAVASQRSLRRLGVRDAVMEPAFFRALSLLPELAELRLERCHTLTSEHLRAIGACRSLRTLDLTACVGVDTAALRELRELPLRSLDLRGTRCEPAAVRELAAQHWPGCVVTLADGQRFTAPR